MTDKAKKLLRRIGDTEEASLKLSSGMGKAADELIAMGFAALIPIARGGADIALTGPGVEEYERHFGKDE